MRFHLPYLAAGLVSLGIVTALFSDTHSNSNGPGGGRTGAPGENTCNECHGNTLNPAIALANTVTLQTGGNPVTEYTPGQTYTVTVGFQALGFSTRGFQITSLDAQDRMAGSFTAGTGNSLRSANINGQSRGYVTHSSRISGTSTSFTWRAPATAVGPVTFYLITYNRPVTGGNQGSPASVLQTSTHVFNPFGTITTPPPVPTINISGLPLLCEGDSVQLTSSAINGNVWSNGDTNRIITVRTGGSYSVRARNSCCTSEASLPVTVTVSQRPAVPVAAFQDSTTILVSNPVQGITYALTLNNAPVNVSASGRFTVAGVRSGYQVRAITNGGCRSLPFDVPLVVSIRKQLAKNQLAVSLMPNPAHQAVQLRFDQSLTEAGTIRIIDATGKVVAHSAIIPGLDVQTLDINTLAKGSYRVVIQSSGRSAVLSLVKE